MILGQVVSRSLNDGLFNAGLLGFYHVLDHGGFSISVNGAEISFDSEVFTDFTSQYLNTLIDTFGKDTVFIQIEGWYQELLQIAEINKTTETVILKAESFLVEKLKRNSYLAAYEILAHRGENVDFVGKIKESKETRDFYEKKMILLAIIEKAMEYRDVFLLKDIAYTKIQPFWSNIAFLNRMENKSEFSQTFEKSFTTPVNDFLADNTENKQQKTELFCCQCGSPITKGQASSMSWINDEGIDLNRKTSYFWNHVPDSYLCPVCNLIYACVPLGFYTKGQESVFVNQNNSFKSLLAFSAVLQAKQDNSDVFYTVIQSFLKNAEQTTAKNELINIQVIRRSGERYYHNILSKDKLSSIRLCEKNFDNLVGKSVKIGENYVNLYREVLTCVLNNTNLYSFINDCLHYGIADGKQVGFVKNLIDIQTQLFHKGEKSMGMDLVNRGYHDGFFLRQKMVGPDRNENKLRGLSFKLVNSLKSRNQYLFSDTVLRQYLSEGSPSPKALIEVLENEENFLNYGYSFLTGLNSYNSKEGIQDKQNVTINEEGINNA
jgi:CRISPR-associated protein Cst1